MDSIVIRTAHKQLDRMGVPAIDAAGNERPLAVRLQWVEETLQSMGVSLWDVPSAAPRPEPGEARP